MPGTIQGSSPFDNAGYGSPNADQSYWSNNWIGSDWLNNQDSFAHNEALAAFERESTFNANQAQIAREWEKMMSDTQFQRKVADLEKAGFSPLAALESGGNYAPMAPAASANAKAGYRSYNGVGGLLGSIIGAFALIASKGITAASTANKASSDVVKTLVDDTKTKLTADSAFKDMTAGSVSFYDLARNAAKTGGYSGAYDFVSGSRPKWRPAEVDHYVKLLMKGL